MSISGAHQWNEEISKREDEKLRIFDSNILDFNKNKINLSLKNSNEAY